MSTNDRIVGTARFVGAAADFVHDGPRAVQWVGEAGLYILEPPLQGFRTVVASTLAHAPRLTAAGGPEYGVETFLWGVTGEDLQLDLAADELPGSGWGNTVTEAMAEAGYVLA